MNFDTKAQLKPFPDFNCLSTVYYEKLKTGNAQNIKRFQIIVHLMGVIHSLANIH